MKSCFQQSIGKHAEPGAQKLSTGIIGWDLSTFFTLPALD
uniref:Uncharacterized protein n=1 Tax=Rhizophora mucronata TaxID=61149 RepID=A0A2P2P1I3_RHIMU